MDIDKKLIDKIENIVKLSDEFDFGFKIIIDLPNDKIDEKNIENIYLLTKKYIIIRKLHGELLLFLNKLINSVNYNQIETNNDEQVNNKENEKLSKILYDISTFNSLMININELITNIDYEYKKFALKYPKFINKKPLTLILLTDNKEENKKYSEIIEQLKIKFPEHIYKITKCEYINKKIKCNNEIDELNLKLKINSLPMIYIIKNSNVVEIPINEIENIESMLN